MSSGGAGNRGRVLLAGESWIMHTCHQNDPSVTRQRRYHDGLLTVR